MSGGTEWHGSGGATVLGRPERSAVGGVGRPPWWAVAVSLLITAGVTADLLAGSTLGSIDARVSGVVSGWGLRYSAAYPFLWVCTQPGGRGFILMVLAVLVGCLGWTRRSLLPAVRVVLALVLLTGVVYAFKYGVGRTAPAYPGSYFHRGGESFPSGHVANAVLMWGVMRWQAVEFGAPSGWQRLFRVMSVAGPVIAGCTMVALDFHWFSDVVAGAAVGIVLLGVMHALDAAGLPRWVCARIGRRSR